MFDIVGSKSLDSNAIDFTTEGINFIGRTFENNGIQGKILKQKFEPNEPFTITATVIGNYKYVKFQVEPYYCSQNINKLTPKEIISIWNEKIAYYFASNIQKFVSLYDKQQGGYKLEDIKKHPIYVPLKNKEIDFKFIEDFITQLENEKIKELEAYLEASELKDYTLTIEEEKVLEDFKNRKITFNDFNVIDVFNVKNSRNILSRDIAKDSGKTPYLSASSENNGVSSYISYDENYLDKGNCIFIGGKTFVVSYHEKDFYSNDSHNLILYLKNEEKSKLNQLFLATCINKSLGYKYSWGDSISNKKIQTDEVSLPIQNQEPDYVIMETLISAIQKLVIKDVVLYTNKKLGKSQ